MARNNDSKEAENLSKKEEALKQAVDKLHLLNCRMHFRRIMNNLKKIAETEKTN